MSTIILEIDDPLRIRLEAAANKSGVTLEQFVLGAASESVSQFEIFEAIKGRVRSREPKAFEDFLAAVPDAEPIHPDDVIK